MLYFVAATLFMNCGIDCTKGSGNITTSERQVSEFNSVDLRGSGKVIIRSGDSQTVVVKCDDNILPLLKTEVRGKTLRIYTDKCVNTDLLEVEISMNTLRNISVSGSGSIIGTDTFDCKKASIDVSGSGSVDLSLNGDKLETDISGSGSVRLAGKMDKHDMDVSGSGHVSALDMQTNDAVVSISGSGRCELQVTDYLEVDISGSGTVLYRGKPKLNTSLSGNGNIRSLSE